MKLTAPEVGTRTPVTATGLDRAFDLTLARRCIPAGHAGQPIAGDFYDTCVLDDHRLLIAVGDVAGHGPGAGSRMRLLSAAVRRLARWTSSPTELLSVLDETYVLGNEEDIATVWIGIYDSDTGVLHYASAGHPPPVLAECGAAPYLLEAASAPPLGTGQVAAHALAHEVLWPAGAVLVAYSDGLVERRGHDLEEQIHGLCRLVGSTRVRLGGDATPRLLARTLLDAVVPDAAAAPDDVCILVLHRAVESTAAGRYAAPPRRLGPTASPAEAAEEDRRLAAEDRRRAASYLYASYRDATTGALHRKPGREQIQLLLDRARREASALTFVFLDVDGLKLVNDTHGHGQGDALLAALGTALRDGLRSYDVVVRYGGDEFVCALPGGTVEVAEARLAEVRSVLGEHVEGATVSAGYAALQETDTLDDVIDRADRDLYRARRSEQRPAPGRAPPRPDFSAARARPSVACGVCGSRVALAEFVVELTDRVTRSADCPECGATTVIQLLTVPPPPALRITDDG